MKFLILAIWLIAIALGTRSAVSLHADPYSWAMADEKDYPVELKIPSGEGRLMINLKTGIVEYYNTTLDESSLAFWNYVMDAFPWVKRQIIRDYLKTRERVTERTK